MKAGIPKDLTPVEEQDLENMWTNDEEKEKMENLDWMELALDDPLFKVRSTPMFASNLYSIDRTQQSVQRRCKKHGF